MLGEAVDLDADARRVTARRPDESTYTLDYDVLIVAVGMRQSYFGQEEFAQWAPGMKTLDDALSVRRRLFGAFEMAETLPPGPQRDAWLTFAIAGGGPTGVELAGQIREMATRALANEFHSIEPQDARVLLFDGGSCVLGSFARAFTDKATKILQNLGVELHMGVHVTDVRHDGVTVTPKAGGAPEEFAARTVLWTAGVEAVPFARRIAKVLDAKSDDAGRIAVAADLSVPGYPEIFVIGDLVGRDNLPAWLRTPCRAESTLPPAFVTISPARPGRTTVTAMSAARLTSAEDTPCYKPPGQLLRVHRLAGLGTHPHRVSDWRGEPHQHTHHVAGHDRTRPPHRPNVHPW